VARRHPDIKWLRRREDVAGFARTQAAILDALWPLLAPGGRMLYCTCSIFPEENADQVHAFMARHPDARRLPPGDGGEALQLLPDENHDGFFYALLSKE
jgi:16S rRNA (cytosine967-C5)-methyltransferase